MAFLKIVSGSGQGRTVEIDGDETIIGRDPGNDLTVEDAAVSTRHCAILRKGREFTLRDLNSTNGTTLNGERTAETRLKAGDEISIGSVSIVIEGEDIEAPEAKTSPRAKESSSTRKIVATTDTVSGISSARFGARSDTKWIWRTVIALLCAAAAVLLVWFFWRLFQG